jgi:lipopolysaccharide export system protein LptC
MTRLHLVSILLLIVLLGAFSNWLLTSFETQPLGLPKEARHDPDYFLDNFTATVMSAAGTPHYRLVAQRLDHYPDDGSIEIQALTLYLYRDNLPEWTVVAEQGRVLDKGEQIELLGEVTLHRPPGARQAEIAVLTRDLTVYPGREYAETAAAVTITSGESRMQATGMQLDLNMGLLKLLSATEGRYVIPAR